MEEIKSINNKIIEVDSNIVYVDYNTSSQTILAVGKVKKITDKLIIALSESGLTRYLNKNRAAELIYVI